MNFLVNTKEVNHALSLIRTVINPRANGNLAGLQITAKDNSLNIQGTDGSCTIFGNVNSTVLEEGSAVVPTMFADILAKQPGDEVQISLDGNSVVILGGGGKKKLRSSVAIMNGSLPVPDKKSETVFRMKSGDFGAMLDSVRYALASDESRQVLTGLFLEILPEKAMATALDGFRMSHYGSLKGTITLPAGSEGVKGTIPGRAVGLMAKIARCGMDDEEILIGLSKKGITAECGGFTLQSALLAGEYVDYTRLLGAETNVHARVRKDAVRGALDRVSIYTSETKDSYVKLRFENGVLKLSAQSKHGNTEEEIDAEVQDCEGAFNIAFNANYLKDTVKAVVGENVVFGFGTPVKPAVVSDGITDKVEILLPVRVFEASSAA